MILLLSLLALLSACGHFTAHETKDSAPTDRERVLRLYAAELEKTSGWLDGWARPKDCDATVFAGEAKLAGVETKISRAEREGDRVGRRHNKFDPCWKPNRSDDDQLSRSQCSRDTITGYLAGAWAASRLGGLRRLADYLEENDWYCGRPPSIGVTKISPNLRCLIGRMILALSNGEEDRGYCTIPPKYFAVSEPFERHIQVLGIYLYGQVNARLEELGLTRIRGDMLSRLKKIVKKHPRDPLFQAVLGAYTGDMSQAIELLVDSSTPAPAYARSGAHNPDPRYARVVRLLAAKIVLERTGGFHGA